jgi:CDGSH-type Zn-finger protein
LDVSKPEESPGEKAGVRESDATPITIKVTENGPYQVQGAPLVRMLPVYNEHGDGLRWERGPDIEHEQAYELCRCGASKNKPFCDGSEKEIGFDGTEVADRRPTAERRRVFSEAPISLTDDRKLCAHQAFCERFPRNAWSIARGEQGPEDQDLLIYMVRRCPSGRLQYRMATDAEPYEEDLPKEVAVVNDGPLWIRGGIPVESADGFSYEVRNRQALCRCGQSKNKPFCDGSHWKVEFKDPVT